MDLAEMMNMKENDSHGLSRHPLFTDPNVRRLLIRELDELKSRRERAENRALIFHGIGMICMIVLVVCLVAWRFSR